MLHKPGGYPRSMLGPSCLSTQFSLQHTTMSHSQCWQNLLIILLWIFVSWHWKDVMQMFIKSHQSYLAPVSLPPPHSDSYVPRYPHERANSYAQALVISYCSEALFLLVHLETFSPSKPWYDSTFMNILLTYNTLPLTNIFLCPCSRCCWHLALIPWDNPRSHLEILVHVYDFISQDSVPLDLRTFSDHKSMSSPHVVGKSGGGRLPQKQPLTIEGWEFIPYFTKKPFWRMFSTMSLMFPGSSEPLLPTAFTHLLIHS